MRRHVRRRRARTAYVNGKWLAQSPSGTQRYATQVVSAAAAGASGPPLTLVLPRDAVVPAWAQHLPTVRSRLRGTLFEQVALPWLTRGGHLYSMANPAPMAKRHQTVVLHDAMPFRFPATFRPQVVLWYWLMYGVLSRRAGRLVTVSSFSRSELADVLRVPETRFDLAPCGSDHIGRGAPAVDPEPPFPAGTYALVVGNLARHKNVAPAAAALAAAGIPVAVVGGPQRNVFVGADTPEIDGVRWLGRVDDARLEALYADAGVLVAPSRYEGFGIPVIEAGRLGCPSVHAAGSSLAEVAGDGGLTFDPDDMDECVATVRAVLTDPDLRARLSEAARRNALRFSWAETARTLFGPGSTDAPERDGPPLRVLHVTESFLAGTGMAIAGFAEATRAHGVESHLLAHDRGSGLLGELDGIRPFASARIVAGGTRELWRALGPAVAEIRPDVVHLHSSLAGLVGRLRPRLAGSPAIVYSPHCFAFERRDVTSAHRWLFRAAEKIAAWRTDAYVCVSPHEAALAARLRPGAPIDTVVNCVEVFDPPDQDRASVDGPLRVVTAGRLAPQKDPGTFAAVLRALAAAGADVEGTWIGSGTSSDLLEVLREAGVDTVGWVSPDKLVRTLAEQSVYLHTALWEAAIPIAVIDAMRAGVPVVVRHNDAYDGMVPPEWQFTRVQDAVEMIVGLRDPAARERRVEEQFAVLRGFRRWGPQVGLAAAYRRVARPGTPAPAQGGTDG